MFSIACQAAYRTSMQSTGLWQEDGQANQQVQRTLDSTPDLRRWDEKEQ